MPKTTPPHTGYCAIAGSEAGKAQGREIISAGFAGSPFGPCLVAQSSEGICRLSFPGPGQEEKEWATLERTWPEARITRDDALAALVAATIFSETGQSLPVHLKGTPFQLMVWQALRQVPSGATASYGQLAAAIGRPKTARAVAGAVAKNPVAFLIPCHRIIAASGAIGGYRWGKERKKALLEQEKARQKPGTPL